MKWNNLGLQPARCAKKRWNFMVRSCCVTHLARHLYDLALRLVGIGGKVGGSERSESAGSRQRRSSFYTRNGGVLRGRGNRTSSCSSPNLKIAIKLIVGLGESETLQLGFVWKTSLAQQWSCRTLFGFSHRCHG